jgi:hypothetical protein
MNYIFRGLTEDNNWVYGSLIQRTDGIVKLSLIEVQDKDGEITVHQVKDDSVGMWTGWTDRHGNNIFSGDTLRGMMGEQQRDRSHYDPIVSVVELKRGGFEVFSRPMSSAVMGAFYWHHPAGFVTPAKYWTIDEWEVTGNIYDVNPASGQAGINYNQLYVGSQRTSRRRPGSSHRKCSAGHCNGSNGKRRRRLN